MEGGWGGGKQGLGERGRDNDPQPLTSQRTVTSTTESSHSATCGCAAKRAAKGARHSRTYISAPALDDASTRFALTPYAGFCSTESCCSRVDTGRTGHSVAVLAPSRPCGLPNTLPSLTFTSRRSFESCARGPRH